MTNMLEEVKSFFADLQALKEAEIALEAEQATGGISDAARNSITALARHEQEKKKAKSGQISDASAMLHPDDEAKHHNLVSSELLGTPEKPGMVRKHAAFYGRKLNMDPDDIVSDFAAGSSRYDPSKKVKKGTRLPMRDTYLQHGDELLAGQPGHLENLIKGNMGRNVRDALSARKVSRRRETSLGAGDEETFIKPEVDASAKQREMSPPRATIFNAEQKKLADLIHKHIEDARKNHGEKGTELAIHPDTMHDILHGHFFHGKSGAELAQEFGHKVPLKKASGDPTKDAEARKKRLYNELKGFQHLISPHFDKPKESAPPAADDAKIAAATKTVSDFAPDPEENPKGHEDFTKAAKLYRDSKKREPKQRDRLLPIEQDPNTRISRESPKTNRAIGKLKTLKKPQPVEDPNAEPETPQAATTTAHDSPRTPGMESVNLAGRLFGEGLGRIIGSVR